MKKLSLLISALLLSCSSTGSKTISIQRDAVLTESGKSKKLKAGDSFEIKDAPIYLDSPGHNTTVLLPILDKDKKVVVDLMPVSPSSQRESELLNSTVSKLLPRVVEVQSSILSGDCLDKTESLLRDFKNISYLRLFKAACLASKGSKQEAKAIVDALSKDFPEDETVSAFLEALK